MLKAGVSIVDISPKEGVQLAGYPHCPRPNKGVHDPLYAACLYLNNGVTDVVIVTLDLLYIGKKHVRTLREKIGKNIMFTASHTHSGPWASTMLASEIVDNIHDDKNYISELLTRLEEAIREVISNTFDAKLGTYSGHCGSEQGVGGNRRIPNGLCDPSVNIIAVKDTNDDVRACLLNYALHPTYLHAENEFVTADYPGYVRRYLQFACPKAIFLFAQGTSGNQSSRYHRVGQNFEEAARVGTTLGVEVFHCIEKIKYSSDINISVQSEEIELPIREFSPLTEAEEKMRIARAEFAAMDDSDYIKKRNCELAMFGAENIFNYSSIMERGQFVDDELPCEIQMLVLGDTLIVGIQGELFVEYGLEIKKASPFEKTFVFEVTNGSLPGYIYTPEAGKEGGYEVGTSVFSDQAGNIILEQVNSRLLNIKR